MVPFMALSNLARREAQIAIPGDDAIFGMMGTAPVIGERPLLSSVSPYQPPVEAPIITPTIDYGAKVPGSMMPMETMPTETALRGSAGFAFPPELKPILPLLLIFGLVVLILFKK